MCKLENKQKTTAIDKTWSHILVSHFPFPKQVQQQHPSWQIQTKQLLYDYEYLLQFILIFKKKKFLPTVTQNKKILSHKTTSARDWSEFENKII